MASIASPASANGHSHLQNLTSSKLLQPKPNGLPQVANPILPATRAAQIPVVDISGLQGDGKSAVITELGNAIIEWGFVQVINHGVPQRALDGVWEACERFFSLPAEEKKPFLVAKSSSIQQWRETMHIRGVLGPQDLVPPICREAIVEYTKEMRALTEHLYDAVLEFLGVPLDVESKAEFISTSGLSIHSYPPCPELDSTIGLLGHTDLATMALLLQDQVSGFELHKGEEWLSFKPLEGSLTLVVGEQLEILSNGKFKSVLHRVLANQERTRMAVACFFAPRGDTQVAAFPQLLSEQETSPYKDARRFRDHPIVKLINVTEWFVG